MIGCCSVSNSNKKCTRAVLARPVPLFTSGTLQYRVHKEPVHHRHIVARSFLCLPNTNMSSTSTESIFSDLQIATEACCDKRFVVFPAEFTQLDQSAASAKNSLRTEQLSCHFENWKHLVYAESLREHRHTNTIGVSHLRSLYGFTTERDNV